MKPRTLRFLWIVAALAVLGAAAFFVLNAFQSNLVFFFTPTQIHQGQAPQGRTFRVGGMVLEGSLKREGEVIHFVVTDTAQQVPVTFNGLLPDLFKEGRGVVAQGKLNDDGMFVASEVLAKHDENYMPPEAQHAIDQAEAAREASTLKMPSPSTPRSQP
jgi:cytochrome c-type biogenesis protein CcmE